MEAALHCSSLPPRTTLYRLMQVSSTVLSPPPLTRPAPAPLYCPVQSCGVVRPPTGAEYKDYPEALRAVAHQARDLCFWPVQVATLTTLWAVLHSALQVGPEEDETEQMRRRMQVLHWS